MSTPAIVQQAYTYSAGVAATAGTTVTVTLPAAATVGNTLLFLAAGGCYQNGNAAIVAPAGLVALAPFTIESATQFVQSWSLVVTAAATAFAFTAAGGNSDPLTIYVLELSGVASLAVRTGAGAPNAAALLSVEPPAQASNVLRLLLLESAYTETWGPTFYGYSAMLMSSGAASKGSILLQNTQTGQASVGAQWSYAVNPTTATMSVDAFGPTNFLGAVAAAGVDAGAAALVCQALFAASGLSADAAVSAVTTAILLAGVGAGADAASAALLTKALLLATALSADLGASDLAVVVALLAQGLASDAAGAVLATQTLFAALVGSAASAGASLGFSAAPVPGSRQFSPQGDGRGELDGELAFL